MADLHAGGQRGAGHEGLTKLDARQSQEVERWLKRATAGLPPALQLEIKEELYAHYEDALADYRSQGFSVLEAHRAVLADMGQESVIADGYRTVHLAARYYLAGIAAALLYPLCYIGFLMMLVFVGYYVVMEAIYYLIGILLSTLLVFYCFRRLLANQINFDEDSNLIDESLVVVGLGLICSMLIGFTGWAVFGTETSLMPWPGLFSIQNYVVEQILVFITDVGSLLVGIALFVLGIQVAFHSAFNLRLMRALGAIMLVLGGVITFNTLNYLFEIVPEQLWYLSVVTEGLHLTVCLLLFILFGQALLRERSTTNFHRAA